MKKFFSLCAVSLILTGFSLSAAAEPVFQNDFTRLDNIGIRLIKSNGIKHRFTFNFTGIPNFGMYPVLMDSAYATDINLHNNREIKININDYARMTSDDEVAALVARYLAQGENSYTGLFHGQFFWSKEVFSGKSNELKYDKKAVDYLVNAGYNPVAILTAYNKTLPEWRGDLLTRRNKASVRLKTVKDYILEKHPKYLDDKNIRTLDFFPNL